MAKRNPDNNTVLQALLDLTDRGMGEWKVKDLVTRISTDPKLRTDLQKAWNSHAYPEKSLVYAQMGITQQLYGLSDAALRIITLLGLYCHQNGLIQARLDDICSAVAIGRSSAKKAITELCECGALVVAIPSAQHAAPIYCVNPALMHKGTRRKANIAAFEEGLAIDPKAYILNRRPSLVVQTDTVRTQALVYSRLRLVSETEIQTVKKHTSRKSKSKADDSQVPGQMTIDDFIKKEEAVGDE